MASSPACYLPGACRHTRSKPSSRAHGPRVKRGGPCGCAGLTIEKTADRLTKPTAHVRRPLSLVRTSSLASANPVLRWPGPTPRSAGPGARPSYPSTGRLGMSGALEQRSAARPLPATTVAAPFCWVSTQITCFCYSCSLLVGFDAAVRWTRRPTSCLPSGSGMGGALVQRSAAHAPDRHRGGGQYPCLKPQDSIAASDGGGPLAHTAFTVGQG